MRLHCLGQKSRAAGGELLSGVYRLPGDFRILFDYTGVSETVRQMMESGVSGGVLVLDDSK